jgi:hypothetical protein
VAIAKYCFGLNLYLSANFAINFLADEPHHQKNLLTKFSRNLKIYTRKIFGDSRVERPCKINTIFCVNFARALFV